MHLQLNTLCSQYVLSPSLVHDYTRDFVSTLFPGNLHTWQRRALFFIVSSSIHSYWTSPRDFLPPNATYTQALMTKSIPPKYLGQRQGNFGYTSEGYTYVGPTYIHANLKAMYLSHSLTLPHILILSLSLSYGGWYIYRLSINIYSRKSSNAKREVKEGQRVFWNKKKVLMCFIYGHRYYCPCETQGIWFCIYVAQPKEKH